MHWNIALHLLGKRGLFVMSSFYKCNNFTLFSLFIFFQNKISHTSVQMNAFLWVKVVTKNAQFWKKKALHSSFGQLAFFYYYYSAYQELFLLILEVRIQRFAFWNTYKHAHGRLVKEQWLANWFQIYHDCNHIDSHRLSDTCC